jgi:hypothetical protein
MIVDQCQSIDKKIRAIYPEKSAFFFLVRRWATISLPLKQKEPFPFV